MLAPRPRSDWQWPDATAIGSGLGGAFAALPSVPTLPDDIARSGDASSRGTMSLNAERRFVFAGQQQVPDSHWWCCHVASAVVKAGGETEAARIRLDLEGGQADRQRRIWTAVLFACWLLIGGSGPGSWASCIPVFPGRSVIFRRSFVLPSYHARVLHTLGFSGRSIFSLSGRSIFSTRSIVSRARFFPPAPPFLDARLVPSSRFRRGGYACRNLRHSVRIFRRPGSLYCRDRSLPSARSIPGAQNPVPCGVRSG